MRTVLADKMFYFKKVNYTGCFANKSYSYVVPWSKLNNITYYKDENITKFNFKDTILKQDGNVIPEVIDILNRPYTNGVIIEEDDTIKEMV
jgi:hypothetical protein